MPIESIPCSPASFLATINAIPIIFKPTIPYLSALESLNTQRASSSTTHPIRTSSQPSIHPLFFHLSGSTPHSRISTITIRSPTPPPVQATERTNETERHPFYRARSLPSSFHLSLPPSLHLSIHPRITSKQSIKDSSTSSSTIGPTLHILQLIWVNNHPSDVSFCLSATGSNTYSLLYQALNV